MTAEEFDAWQRWAVQDYARDDARYKDIPIERTRADMTAFMERELGGGVATEGHRLRIVEDAGSGDRVGYTWLARRETDAGPVCWVFHVWIDEPMRARGYGRALMAAIEVEARDMGFERVELYVYAANEAARRLYRSAGYKELGIEMAKRL